MLAPFWMLITTLEERRDQWFVGTGATTTTKAMEKAQYVMRWSGGIKEKIIIFDRY